MKLHVSGAHTASKTPKLLSLKSRLYSPHEYSSLGGNFKSRVYLKQLLKLVDCVVAHLAGNKPATTGPGPAFYTATSRHRRRRRP